MRAKIDRERREWKRVRSGRLQYANVQIIYSKATAINAPRNQCRTYLSMICAKLLSRRARIRADIEVYSPRQKLSRVNAFPNTRNPLLCSPAPRTGCERQLRRN